MALTYLAYVLRAVRWRIFLKPVRKTTTVRLLAPQFVGFAALALLGRAGEMIRPYIIAKKERLTFTSQVAVWGVERIFDMGAFAVMLARQLPVAGPARASFYHQLREASFLLMALIVVLIVGMVDRAAFGRSGGAVPARPLGRIRSEASASSARKSSVVQPWTGNHSGSQLGAATGRRFARHVGAVAFAYYAMTHAYPGELQQSDLAT